MASPFPSIAAAVKTVIDGVTGAPTTVVRKRGAMRRRETPPLCVISFGGEGKDEWATMGTGTADQGGIGKRYAIDIAVYRDAGGDLDVNLSTNPDFIDAAKEALNKASLSGVSSVWDTNLEEHDEWESQPFRDGAEVSKFRLWFQTSESRI